MNPNTDLLLDRMRLNEMLEIALEQIESSNNVTTNLVAQQGRALTETNEKVEVLAASEKRREAESKKFFEDLEQLRKETRKHLKEIDSNSKKQEKGLFSLGQVTKTLENNSERLQKKLKKNNPKILSRNLESFKDLVEKQVKNVNIRMNVFEESKSSIIKLEKKLTGDIANAKRISEANETLLSKMLDNHFKAFSEKFEGLANEMSSLKNEVKNEVSGLKNEVSSLNSEVSGLKSEMSGLKSEVSGLKSNLYRLEASVDRIEGSLRLLD